MMTTLWVVVLVHNRKEVHRLQAKEFTEVLASENQRPEEDDFSGSEAGWLAQRQNWLRVAVSLPRGHGLGSSRGKEDNQIQSSWVWAQFCPSPVAQAVR